MENLPLFLSVISQLHYTFSHHRHPLTVARNGQPASFFKLHVRYLNGYSHGRSLSGLGGAKPPPHEPTEILKTTEILALYNFYITYYIQIQAEPRSMLAVLCTL